MFANNSSSNVKKVSVLKLHSHAYKGVLNKFKEFFIYGFFITSFLVGLRLYLEVILPSQLEEGGVVLNQMYLIIILGVVLSIYFSLVLQLVNKRITKSFLNSENKNFWWYLSYANKNLLKILLVFLKSFLYIFVWPLITFILAAVLLLIVSHFLSSFQESDAAFSVLLILQWAIPVLLGVFALGVMIYRSFQLVFIVPAYVEKPREFKKLKEDSIKAVKGKMLYMGWVVFLFSLLLLPYFIAMIAAWVLPLIMVVVTELSFFQYLVFASLITTLLSVVISSLYSVLIYELYLKFK